MPTFMSRYHVGKLNLEQIKNTVNSTDQSGVTTVDMFYNKAKNELYCILDAPSEDAIKDYHANVNLVYDFITSIESIPTQNAKNKEKFQMIGESAARLAHDIRNPLSIIKNILEMMETAKKPDAEESYIYYKRMHKAIDRISNQIEGIIDFVRPTKMSFEKHLLNDILASAIDKIAKPDTIKIIMPTNHVYAMCDFIELEVVFTNLITNSVQAMNNAGQIEIKLVDDDQKTSIQITDTGCGIPQNLLPKIFEPWFTTKQTGTGLGLPSCKQIIEHNYGTIGASSDVGVGTTFTIVLQKNRFASLHPVETNLMQTR